MGDLLCDLPCPALGDEPRCIVQVCQVEDVQPLSRSEADISAARGDGERADGLVDADSRTFVEWVDMLLADGS